MPTYPVRVKPGASRTKVGGAYGDPPALVVAVSAPAVDGRATEAVLVALAEALGTRRADLHVRSGHTARTKLIEIPASAEARWVQLRDGG